MKILALDTSTEACSAALFLDGHVHEEYALTPRQHTHEILPMVQRVLAEGGVSLRQLDGIAFGRGPGAFTGLRIAAGVTQGLALGAGLPVMPVSSLAALAHQAWRVNAARQVLAALDARMGEVYYGGFQVLGLGEVHSVDAERVSAPAHLPLPEENAWFATGSGWQAYADSLLPRFAAVITALDGEMLPRARDVAHLAAKQVEQGGWLAAREAHLVYLRDNVADKPKPITP